MPRFLCADVSGKSRLRVICCGVVDPACVGGICHRPLASFPIRPDRVLVLEARWEIRKDPFRWSCSRQNLPLVRKAADLSQSTSSDLGGSVVSSA